jgi:hypothetical protein
LFSLGLTLPDRDHLEIENQRGVGPDRRAAVLFRIAGFGRRKWALEFEFRRFAASLHRCIATRRRFRRPRSMRSDKIAASASVGFSPDAIVSACIASRRAA